MRECTAGAFSRAYGRCYIVIQCNDTKINNNHVHMLSLCYGSNRRNCMRVCTVILWGRAPPLYNSSKFSNSYYIFFCWGRPPPPPPLIVILPYHLISIDASSIVVMSGGRDVAVSGDRYSILFPKKIHPPFSEFFMGSMYGPYVVNYKQDLILENLHSFIYFNLLLFDFSARMFRYHSNRHCAESRP